MSGKNTQPKNRVAETIGEYMAHVSQIKMDSLFNYSNLSEFYLRGHPSAEFKYLPSMHRGGKWSYGEANAIRRLKYEYPSEFAADNYMIETLSRLRHMGFPTRLLDVTLNPLVALYFTCSDKNHLQRAGEVSVFCFEFEDVVYMESETTSIIANFSQLNEIEQCLVSDFFKTETKSAFDPHTSLSAETRMALRKFIGHIASEQTSIKDLADISHFDFSRPRILDMPTHQDRIRAQEGAYILFPIQSHNLIEQEAELVSNHVVGKIRIPAECKISMMAELSSYGIRRHKLFPDIETMVTDFVASMWRSGS